MVYLDEKALQTKIKKIKKEKKDPDLHKIIDLFKKFEFKFIDFNIKIPKEDGLDLGEIDILAEFRDYLFIIDVTTQKDDLSKKINDFQVKWNNIENIKRISNLLNYNSLLTKERIVLTINTIHTGKSDEKIIYKEKYDEIKENSIKIGKWARNDLFKHLKLHSRPINTKRMVDVIEFTISEKTAYVFVIDAYTLLDLSYIPRKDDFEGYQRSIGKSRIPFIQKNISSNQSIIFPNSIIVSSSINNIDTRKNIKPKHFELDIPNEFGAFKIIDGQHRMLGFSNLDEDSQKSHYLSIIAFNELDKSDEIRTFIDINSTQKKIDSNLMLNLKSDLEWPINSKEANEKKAVNILKKINNSSLKNKIYFGGKGIKEQIKLKTFVDAIISNNINLDREEKIIFEELDNIFIYLKRNKLDLLYTTTGIRILFKILKKINEKKMSLKTSLEKLKNIYPNYLGIIKNTYGEAGAKKTAEIIMENMEK